MFKNLTWLVFLTLLAVILWAETEPATGAAEAVAESDEEYVEHLYEPANKDSTALMFKAADQALFVMPTAYTMPKGQWAFTDFELLILQLTYAPTDRLHLSAGTVFPIDLELLRSFTVGAKFNYLRHESVQCAFYGSFTPDPDVRIANIGHVLSFGDPRSSIHLGVSKPFGTFEDLIEGGFVASLGGIVDLSKRVAALGELYLYTSAREPAQVFALGLRFKGKDISWDLGGIRPFGVIWDGFIAIPFIKATIVF